MGKSICSFVGVELSFLKLGSVLSGLSGGVSNFSLPKLLFLRSNVCFGLYTGIKVVPGQIHTDLNLNQI